MITITLLLICASIVGICQSCSTVPTLNGTPFPEQCVFPFKFEGDTFFSCTSQGDSENREWCSVEVDLEGNHQTGGARWGHCDPGLCNTKPRDPNPDLADKDGTIQLFDETSGGTPLSECQAIEQDGTTRVCAFPFKYNGVSHGQCITDNDPDGKLWCSFEVDDQGRHIVGRWGHCIGDCGQDQADECVQSPEIDLPASGTFLPDYDNCGKSNGFDSFKVIGGSTPPIGKYTFPVMLGRQSSPIFCGGSLINRMYVLTAAHCVKGRPPTIITVGEHTLGQDCDCLGSGGQRRCNSKPQRIPVDRVIPHPGYKTGKDDIALVRLREPVRLSAQVQLICLPHDSLRMASILGTSDIVGGLEGRDGTVVGWGATRNRGDPSETPGDTDDYQYVYEQNNEESDSEEAIAYSSFYDEADGLENQYDLINHYDQVDGLTEEDDDGITEYLGKSIQEVTHPIISTRECQSLWFSYRQSDHICAGRNGKGSCFGDSGGPLVVRGSDGTMFQIGVVSYGARRCAERKPSVYTRVSRYMEWIRENLRP